MSEALAGLPPPPPPAEPRPAAAVILWRQGPADREVFWVRRGEALSFAGGFYAFPGGRLDLSDLAVPVPGLEGEAAALVACACRELFEETGVLLARGAARLGRAEREAARRAVLAEHQNFGAFLAEKGLGLDPSLLDPAGRWVTPPFSPIRFDARFFAARLPPGEEPVVWPGELSAGEFVPTRRALDLWERGEVLLHPPNLWGIACLARPALPEALAALRGTPPDRIQFQKGVWLAALRTPTLPPAAHTNAWLVDLGDGLAVVDPGSPWPEEQARLDALLEDLAAEGKPPREIWLTHHHADHVGGVARLAGRGLAVRAHALTAARLGMGARPLADGDLLAGRWRVLHTPGHARGHLAFHDERSGSLIAGDMVSTLSTVVIDPPEGDMAEYLRQLERLRALSPRTVYPAHGLPAPNGPAKLDEYLVHRRVREEQVLAALARGGALGEVTAEAYQDTPAAMLPVAERSCLASLEKLRAEGRARLEGGRWSRP
ncbi:MAG TPA: MBL fold metallo-hydrolase [Anaeromyxobacteraceae bacterium]|nr:MBL fold metallo-hydrolase [Anaeromyxobacteraceae bacterium]